MLAPFFFGAATASIKWHENYEEAKEQSVKESKPLLLFFTGSDWCSWCTKLEKEVFETKEFAEGSEKDFVFVNLDYPMYKKQDKAIVDQNKQLLQRFGISAYPSVIILTPKEEKMGVTGYRRGGGADYSQHLKKIVSEYKDYYYDTKK